MAFAKTKDFEETGKKKTVKLGSEFTGVGGGLGGERSGGIFSLT